MSLASNTTMIAPLVEAGSSYVPMALTALVTLGPNGEFPTVAFPGGGITATVLSVTDVNCAVPGNTYPSASLLLSLELEIATDAPLGLQSVQVTNFGQSPAVAAPAFLNVVSAGALSQHTVL